MSLFGLPIASGRGGGGGGGGGSAAFFTGLRLMGIFCVSDPTYGAVGNGVANDRPAIVAADAAAAAYGAVAQTGAIVYFNNPTVAYMTDQELSPSYGNSWRGEASALGECTIRASVAIRSLIAVRTTKAPILSNVPFLCSGLTLDGNGLTKYGFLANSMWLSVVRQVFVENVLLDGFHLLGHRLPLQLSAVVSGGGAGVATVSQPDTGYTNLAPGATNIVVKALSGTTYVVSYDGGATFSTATQTIIPGGPSNIFMLASAAIFSWASGVQITFPGAVAAGNTWSFTATVQAEDSGGQPSATNPENIFEDCWVAGVNGAGYIYTAGLVNTTAGSLIVTASNAAVTQWLTAAALAGKNARPRDFINITGLGALPIAGIADDGTIHIAPTEVVGATLANATYTLCVGYGYYEDDSGDAVKNSWSRGRLENCANGMAINGDSAGTMRVDRVLIDSIVSPGVGILVGGIRTGGAQSVLDCVEVKPTASNAGSRFYVMGNCGATIIEPRQGLAAQTQTEIFGQGAATIILQGSIFRYDPFPHGTLGLASMNLPIGNLQLIPQQVALNAANQVLTPPPISQVGPVPPTYTILQPTQDFIGAANVPLLGAPNAVGQVWILENQENSAFYVQLQDSSTLGGANHVRLSGCTVVIGPGERIILISQLVGAFATTPVWSQFGDVHRAYTGPVTRGSGSGPGSSYVVSNNAGQFDLAIFDTTFGPTNGFMVEAMVSAENTASTDRAFFGRVFFAVDSTGAFIPGTFVVGYAAGTNAGAPPAGYALQVVNAGGFVKLQATTGAAVTAKWLCKYEMMSAVRV